MGFLGIDFAQTTPHYRRNRFLAFLIDLAIVVAIWFLAYQIVGQPDFFAVRAAMDEAQIQPTEQQQDAMNQVFARFDEAFQFSLILWFGYETLTTVLLQGCTIGKFLMGLRITPLNPKRNPVLHAGLLAVRSALKMLSLYLLQGFPFLICALTVFTTNNRSGFDMFVKTQTIQRQRAPAG